MSTATETATIHMAATKRIEKKMGEFENLIAPMMEKIFRYDPSVSPLATLTGAVKDRDYEDAKELIRETVEAYR